ncbi:MAG TPA: SIMPL domain-containing protein [Allosphingosinicella sp.]|jgi:hypothetical protein
MRLAGLIALALAGVTAPATPAAAQDVAISLAPGEVLLKVEAEGEHLARPDVVSIQAGVVTTGRTAKEALAANAQLANRLVLAVRGAGVEPRDMQTSNLAVTPQFARDRMDRDEEEGVRSITGYVARNTLALRLRDLSKAADIINALFEAGANEVRGPRFSLSDPAPAIRAARLAAVAAARAEAETYAEALGMRVSRVLRVSEREPFDTDEEGGSIIVTGSAIRPAPLEPGEVSTSGRVWIDYALAPR